MNVMKRQWRKLVQFFEIEQNRNRKQKKKFFGRLNKTVKTLDILSKEKKWQRINYQCEAKVSAYLKIIKNPIM